MVFLVKGVRIHWIYLFVEERKMELPRRTWNISDSYRNRPNANILQWITRKLVSSCLGIFINFAWLPRVFLEKVQLCMERTQFARQWVVLHKEFSLKNQNLFRRMLGFPSTWALTARFFVSALVVKLCRTKTNCRSINSHKTEQE